MARKRKPAAFSLAQWAPLNEAFARAKAALSSSDLAERDLLADMRSGRLPSAMRRLVRVDRTETFERLKPTFWTGLILRETIDADLKLTGRVRVAGFNVTKLIASANLWFFVARSALDKLYPVGGASLSTSPADTPPIERRKPGPQPTHDWPLFVASEMIHRAKAGERDPTAAAMIEHCEKHLRWSPGLKEMQLLLKKLLQHRRF